jgi:hypothetical protein
LEVLDTFLYPDLLKDGNNTVLSENITWFRSAETQGLNKTLEEIESKVEKSCQNAEIAYHDSSGNRWIFSVLNGDQSENNLGRMQAVSKKLYRKMSAQML